MRVKVLSQFVNYSYIRSNITFNTNHIKRIFILLIQMHVLLLLRVQWVFEQTAHWFYCKVYIKLYFVFIWLNMIFCYVLFFNMYV